MSGSGCGCGCEVSVNQGAGEGGGVGVGVWQCVRGMGKTRFETRAHIHNERTRTSSTKRNHWVIHCGISIVSSGEVIKGNNDWMSHNFLPSVLGNA